MDNIFARKFDAITYNEPWVKEYFVNIADNIRAICESGFTTGEIDQLKRMVKADTFNLGQQAMGANLLGAMALMAQAMKNPNAYAQQEIQSGAADEDKNFNESMSDTTALFSRYPCNTPGLAQFGKNIKGYVLNEEAPIAAPNAIMNACLRDTPRSKYKSSDFCMCFGGALKFAKVSQADRRELTHGRFGETAVRIMDIGYNRGKFQSCRSGF